MRKTLWFGAAAAALLAIAPSASAQQADQPGDASTQARLAVDETVEGDIDPAGDADWLRLEVAAGQRYRITLEGVAPEADTPALDPTLGIYDRDGNQLAYNDDAGGTLNSALYYTPGESGEVFVEARAFSGEATGHYRLRAVASEIPPDDVGGDSQTAARIASGRSASGAIESEGDTDWYRLNVRSGRVYHIALNSAEGEAGLGDPLLSIVDGEGNVLASNDDADGLNSALDFRPEQRGEVFIVAAGLADAHVGAYTLSVSDAAAPRDNISADNRTRGRASLGDTINGALDFNGDSDWYRIRLSGGQSYRITLNGGEEAGALGDPLVKVHDSHGEELAVDDDGGEGLNSYLEFTAPADGNYFIEARGFGDAATGAYALTVREGDIPASAATDVSLSAEGDYREGVLSPAGDSDWYRLELAEGQAVRIGLNSAESSDALGDPLVIIHDAEGAEAARDDDGGEGLNSWLEFQAPAAGVYFVEARSFADGGEGRYILNLNAGEIGASADNADSLSPNGEGRTSMIGAADDVDWFAIDMVEGRPYRFTLRGADEGALADPMLTLYNSQGEQLAQDDDGGAGLASYLTYAPLSSGTYYAAVSSAPSGQTGRYHLAVSDTDVPGTVYTDETLDAASDERMSRIDMPGDLDDFRVELEGGVSYQIELNGVGDHALTDPFLAVLRAEGENERLTSDDDSGPGLDARLRFTPSDSGVYVLQASGLGGSTGWYTIKIARR